MFAACAKSSFFVPIRYCGNFLEGHKLCICCMCVLHLSISGQLSSMTPPDSTDHLPNLPVALQMLSPPVKLLESPFLELKALLSSSIEVKNIHSRHIDKPTTASQETAVESFHAMPLLSQHPSVPAIHSRRCLG